jgi:hypothetical protein
MVVSARALRDRGARVSTYLVERYLPGRDRAWLEEALGRLPRDDADVSYLGSLYVPSDESCFCRFSAPAEENVRRVNELARVPFARIVAVVELGVVGENGPR